MTPEPPFTQVLRSLYHWFIPPSIEPPHATHSSHEDTPLYVAVKQSFPFGRVCEG